MKNQNRNKIFLALGIVLMFLTPTTMVFADTNEIKSSSENMITYSYENSNELIISFNLQNLEQNQIIINDEIYTTYQIENTGFLGTLGRPQLPVISKLIAVPINDINFEIIDTSYETIECGKIYPAQSPQSDDYKVNIEFNIDDSFYQKDITYPGKIADIVYNGKIRDISFVKIEFYPINYNPNQEIATIYNEITVKLTWESETVNVESGFENAPFSNTYENAFINWQGFIDNTEIVESSKGSGNGQREDGCIYLIVTDQGYYSEVMDLANWKNTKGLMTKVVKMNDIGSTSEQLRQYIQNAYDTWDPAPSYVLLVGDSEQIPTNYLYSAGSDLWYATVDGSDYYPDIFIGRIPADSANEADIIISKILSYEKSPPTTYSFYDNFAVAAYFQDDEQNGYETRRFVRTSEEVRDYLLSLGYTGERIYVTESYINPTNYNNGYYGNGEPLPPELLRPTFAWDGDANDIIDAVNAGVFILNHRDHGGEYAWGDPYFDTTHIEQLTNGNLLPVVFSLNCLTGRFDNYECFCEKFIRKENGGAVALFGATRVSYSGYNDWLARGLYDSMWPNFDTEVGGSTPMYSLGEMLNYGKYYMANTWGDPWDYERYTFELFHVFGDPSMEIWSSVPSTMSVTYQVYPDQLVVNVKKGGNPVPKALVCALQENGFYARGITNSSGGVSLEIINPSQEQVTLTVTAHNCKYNQQTLYLNRAPEPPAKPSGEERPDLDVTYNYETTTTDFEGEDIFYWFDWGDNTTSGWLGPYASGANVITSNSWSERGPHIVKVKAKDINNIESEWSEELIIMVDNEIPETTKLTGKNKNVIPHKSYDYTATGFDADDDPIWIQITFSDGGGTGWQGPFSSGYSLTEKHVWAEENTQYTVRAKTKDIFGEESDWAELVVNTPKSRASFYNLLEIIQKYFPILAKIFERFLTI